MDAVRGPFVRNTTPNSAPYTTGVASHHWGTAQETKPSGDLVQPWPRQTGCEIIETTLRTRRLLWVGAFIRMSRGRLPKSIVFGNIEDAVRKGRGEK